jgi:ketosteroid isomerase-like protein
MTEYAGNETDVRAIDRVREAHVAALNAGDAEAWAAQFTDEAVQMPPNAPANVGRSKIASWSQAFLDQFRIQFALAVDEVRVLGLGDRKRPLHHHPERQSGRPSDARYRQVHNHLPANVGGKLANGARHLEQQQATSRRVDRTTKKQFRSSAFELRLIR